jgi:hypothetical protein
MLHRSPLLRGFALPALAALLSSCADADRSAPLAPADAPLRASSPSAILLECTSTTTLAVSDTIDLVGGVLKLTDEFGGVHEVVFPANAVSSPTIFTLTVPASKFVEVDVTATDPLTGQTMSVTFPADAQPTLAISYKRCTRNDTDNKTLGLYHIDPATDAVLEGPFGAKEGSTTDPRVKGKVPHFSDYSVGMPD